jgi:hypothetical protein
MILVLSILNKFRLQPYLAIIHQHPTLPDSILSEYKSGIFLSYFFLLNFYLRYNSSKFIFILC